jgi:hypothetical protein
MLMPTAVAAALIITSRCSWTINADQKSRRAAGTASNSQLNPSAGLKAFVRSGMNPRQTSAKLMFPDHAKTHTTPKKQATIPATRSFSASSYSLIPRLPLS